MKNSNLLVYVSFNPITWNLKPIIKNVPSYADDWLYDPNMLEYKLSWLFFRISLFMETGKAEDVDEYNFDLI